VWLFVKMVPDAVWAEHVAIAEAASQRPVSRAGVFIVIGIWLAVLAIAAGYALLWRYY